MRSHLNDNYIFNVNLWIVTGYNTPKEPIIKTTIRFEIDLLMIMTRHGFIGPWLSGQDSIIDPFGWSEQVDGLLLENSSKL